MGANRWGDLGGHTPRREGLLRAPWLPISGSATMTNALEEVFSDVRRSKQPFRPSGKHSTTTSQHTRGVEAWRLSAIRCTILYQGVATRNGATTGEILHPRTGAQPNFASTEY